jgi:hypothetical protein
VDELADPGVLLTEYLTGARLYAHLTDDQREGLRRWSVLLGCFSSLGGIWRSGSGFLHLSPAEARLVASRALWFVERIGREAGARNRPVVDWARWVRQELAEGRWLPDRAPRTPTGIAETTRNVISVFLPQLVAEARRLGRAGPRPTDTDRDPLIDGLTLREAATRDGYAERLEVVLRELEHRQGAAGELRRELGLTAG